MELRHLRHFLAVARELHFGRAALSLGMAQPPLSQSIARLEADLGIRLFDRGGRRVVLTPAGQAFLEEARLAVVHADSALRLARGAATGEAGELRIGFVSAALYARLPNALKALKQAHPAIRVRLVELGTNEQVGAIEAGEIDVGFLHPPLGRVTKLEVRAFPPDPLVAVLPDDGGRAASVDLEELARRGLILFPQAHGPVLHAAILDLFAAAGLDVEIVQEAGRTMTMLSLVSAGLGASLLPRAVRTLSFAGVRYADLAVPRVPELALALAARRRPRPPAVDSFLRLIR